jgi:hypothetical protein
VHADNRAGGFAIDGVQPIAQKLFDITGLAELLRGDSIDA